MKLSVPFLVLILGLSACASHPEKKTPVGKTRMVFYKKSASDVQMTADLNECAYRVFKSEIESDGTRGRKKPLSKKDCMQSLGYEVIYH